MKYTKITTMDKLEEGKIHSFETKYMNLGILWIGKEILAFEDVCTHDGERISSGKLENCTITCPRHMARFDLRTGEALCMPATEDLQKLNVRIQDGNVEVELED